MRCERWLVMHTCSVWSDTALCCRFPTTDCIWLQSMSLACLNLTWVTLNLRDYMIYVAFALPKSCLWNFVTYILSMHDWTTYGYQEYILAKFYARSYSLGWVVHLTTTYVYLGVLVQVDCGGSYNDPLASEIDAGYQGVTLRSFQMKLLFLDALLCLIRGYWHVSRHDR